MNGHMRTTTSLPRCRGVVTVASMLVAACAVGDDDRQRDEQTGDLAAWTVSGEPELQIGVVEGNPDYQFHTLISALRLPDGSVAALNAGSHELRGYGADGRLLGRSGRR